MSILSRFACFAVVAFAAGVTTSACFVAPPASSECVRLGSEGGTVQLDGMVLEIPSGALADERVVCASVVDASVATSVPTLTPLVELTPPDTALSRPARLALRPHFDVTGRAVALYGSRDGDRFIPTPAIVDRDIIGSISFFGRFVGGDAPVGDGGVVVTDPPGPNEPNPGPCSVTNCAGCCAEGVCLSGTSNTNCGGGGNACTTCTGTSYCLNGACRSPAACDSTNCAGCCEGDLCLPGTSSSKCGKSGAACAACSAPNVCSQNVCQHPNTVDAGTPVDAGTNPACNASNCSGCCSGTLCLPGASAANCGHGGGACVTCLSPNTCQMGACQPASDAGAACSAANCNGCCAGTICVPGTSSSQCGSGGNNCTTCPAGYACDGTFCVP